MLWCAYAYIYMYVCMCVCLHLIAIQVIIYKYMLGGYVAFKCLVRCYADLGICIKINIYTYVRTYVRTLHTLQRIALHCIALPCLAVHCNALRRNALPTYIHIYIFIASISKLEGDNTPTAYVQSPCSTSLYTAKIPQGQPSKCQEFKQPKFAFIQPNFGLNQCPFMSPWIGRLPLIHLISQFDSYVRHVHLYSVDSKPNHTFHRIAFQQIYRSNPLFDGKTEHIVQSTRL
jgi:hypothetical protein